MNIPSDVTFLVVCANTIITALGFAIIKFNDFSHLEKDVNKISETVESINKRVIKIDKKQAVQEQRIDTLESK